MIALRLSVLSILVVAIGCTAPLDGDARSSMYRVRVMQSAERPCFALQDDAKTRRHVSSLVMVHVALLQSAAMARDGRVIWSIGLPSSVSQTLRGDECIAYGDAPSGADVMVAPEALQYGVAYHVALNTDLLTSGSSENLQYSGDFCLGKLPDGKIRVHDLWRGDDAKSSPDDPCLTLYRVPRK
ncbi:MAG: hypothetical protein LCH70_07760 [Proteobacteria bacterium]|nr:hypothetical protein [Pseudomonadota bacterium]